MTTRNQNVKVYRGDSASFVVGVKHADGTPYDPTIGAILRYRMAATSHTTDIDANVLKWSGGGGITSDNAGNVTIALNPEDTDFPPGVYYHELKIWDGTDVATTMTGAFIIKKAIPMGDKVTPSQGNAKLSAVAPTRTP